MLSRFTRNQPRVPEWSTLTPTDALLLLVDADVPPGPGEDALFVVSSHGQGPFERQVLKFESDVPETRCNTLTVDEEQIVGGPIAGFGGAFTDAAVTNLASADDRESALEWFFSPRGMGYTLTRVHIGSCDFSHRNYSYVTDPTDLDCRTFQLAPEDTERIKWICRAGDARGEPLKILASPWTAPPWMKTGGKGYVGGALRRDDSIYRAWARHFVRFLSSYSDAGLPVWAVTPQNEPNALPAMLRQTWETMFWNESEMVRFIGEFLGPALAAEHPEVMIIAHDDQRLDMPHFIKALIADVSALRHVRGIGFHWYQYPPRPYWYGGGAANHLWSLGRISTYLPHDSFHRIGDSRRLLDDVGRADAILMCTEMCAGFSEVLSPPKLGPSIGDWDRAEVYGEEILRSLSEGMQAWLDWNLVLDEEGGPNWAGNICDAPMILMHSGKLLVQPMCIVIAHFSHFILPGSIRIALNYETCKKHAVAFVAGGRVVVVVLHRSPRPFELTVRAPGRGLLHLKLPAHSIATVSWPLKAMSTLETK